MFERKLFFIANVVSTLAILYFLAHVIVAYG